jgi:hypothetical protein
MTAVAFGTLGSAIIFPAMAFEIRFTDDPNEFLDDDPAIPSAIGLFRAGTVEENFASSLYEWKKEDYEAQWRASLQHFVDGADRAVLITYYVNQKESSNLHWWALYRGELGVVHVQDHMPWDSDFEKPFSIHQASSFLQDRITISETGDPISEWDVPLADIEAFVRDLKLTSERK